MSIDFRGVFTAIVTPFSPDGAALDFGRLREQVQFQAQGEPHARTPAHQGAPHAHADAHPIARGGGGGVAGIVVAGTTGESPTLNEAEYRQLCEKAVELARASGLRVIVGTGSNSTHHAVELQRFAASIGADAALSVNPYYNKPGQEGLYRHFMTQADAAELPVMLYNIPGRTGVALTPETVERLARHPHVRALKEATGSVESCAEMARRCPSLAVLSGDDALTLAFMSVGAVGAVSVVSNLLPARTAALVRAAAAGDGRGALAIHRELMPLLRALFVETNPIPVKGAMRLLGRDSGSVRLPMTEARPETLNALEAALALAGLTPGPAAPMREGAGSHPVAATR